MQDRSGSVAAAAGTNPRRFGRVQWLLLILFIVLELADVATTNRGLSLPGAREANPIMSAFQHHLGDAWWVPKAFVVAWVVIAATRIRHRWPLVFAVSFCSAVVAINLASR